MTQKESEGPRPKRKGVVRATGEEDTDADEAESPVDAGALGLFGLMLVTLQRFVDPMFEHRKKVRALREASERFEAEKRLAASERRFAEQLTELQAEFALHSFRALGQTFERLKRETQGVAESIARLEAALDERAKEVGRDGLR